MNTSAMLLAVVLWLVCTFAAVAFFISRINSVRKYAEKEIKKVNECVNSRFDCFGDSYTDQLYNLAKRVKKLEDSKICILDSGTDEVRKTSLYAITKVGYSTELVSLTDDELAVLNSFIDWAALDDDFVAEKIDKDYVGEDWRSKK